MHRLEKRALLSLVATISACSIAGAQPVPHIGFVYPGGGQRGTTFEAVIGGQYLNGVRDVLVSGEGVKIRVVEHIKPLTAKELNQLRQKLRELQKRLQKARAQSGGGRPDQTIRKIAAELDLDVTDSKSLMELRRVAFSPKRQLNPQIAETVRVGVELAADAEPGCRELRLKTAAGLTNPVRFYVGKWVEYRETEPNDGEADAGAPETLPVVVNGQILPGDVDRFRVTARQGERLVIAARARELIPYLADAVPGWFQATLAVYDSEGREVAYADDYRFDPDPVLCYEVPEDGEYVLEIKDAVYRGREDFVYRIEVGETPYVTSLFPLGCRVGQPAAVRLAGWNLPADEVQLLADHPTSGLHEISLRVTEEVTVEVPFVVDAIPDCAEVEPNDDHPRAHLVELPVIVNGRVDRPGDRDEFRFRASAGDKVVAEVHARRLNSPLDSLLKLFDRDGVLLASNDDHEDRGAGLTTHQADSYVSFTVPADGEYCFRLEDTQQKGGAAYAYRLRISPPRPDFALRVAPSTINARAGSTLPVTVFALRKDGFSGDIQLELKDPPPGFALGGAWVPAGQDSVRCTLSVSPPGESDVFSLCLEGRAVIGGEVVCRQAVPSEDLMQAFIYHHLVPVSDWLVVVAGNARSRVPATVVGERPVKVAAGGTASVEISSPGRRPPGDIRLELDDPPDGITLEGVSADRERVRFVLRAEGGKVQPGQKGNLIVRAFTLREFKSRDGGRVNTRRVPLGTLPAVPFEITER